MILPLEVGLELCFTIRLASFLSSVWGSACEALAFSLSFFRACSRSLMCLSIDSRSRLFVRPSPSSFPIRDFISALSICQAFRSRSCLCHSVCRKRITPVAKKKGSAANFGSLTSDNVHIKRCDHLVMYTLCPVAAHHHYLHRSHRRCSLRCPPCQRSSAMPLSPRRRQSHNHYRRSDVTDSTKLALDPIHFPPLGWLC